VKTFGQYMIDALKQTNDLQKKSDAMNAALAAGEVDDISQVVIAGQKAEIALQLTMQVRNRALSAYQELMRMQV
ncbi:MAG: flagellar hook-basal body complex protein FliE, partial [Schwartzia sp.]|nr:flagellar hook-basal body complex protein FliE [Schwartzia sp. (in: firmicutes)]